MKSSLIILLTLITLSAAAEPLQLSDKERSWLNNHPVISIGIDPDWAPFEYRDQRGNYSGMAADFMALLQQRLGVKIEAARIDSWSGVIKAAKDQRIDGLAAAMKSEQRSRYLSFTSPYLNFPMVILTRVDAPFLGGIDSLGDITVAVVDGYVSHDLMESNHPELRLVPYKTIREALDALSVGEIGAFIGNLASASYAINQLGLTNLKVAAHTPYEFELGIGVRKDWPELRSILEKGLASINEEERKTIMRRWIQLQVDKGFNLHEILIVAIPIGSGIFVILLVVVIWNRRLQKEIIDRQQVEKQLRESEEQLLSSQAIAHIGTWDVDLSSMTMRWSDECFAIHGTSADAYLPAFGTYREFVVDEDRELFMLRTAAVMKGEKHEDSIEYRIKRPDGTIRLLKAYGQLFLNENKQPHRFIGVVHDITDIKMTEQALRDKSQTLQSILDNAPIGIWYQNRDGHPLFVNQDFCNALGVPESKFLSANHYSALFDDEVMQHSIITDAEALSLPGPHSSSEKIKFRDGELHDLELTKIRTTDEKNNVTGLIGLSIDVTEKRKNEALLRKQAYFDELTGLPNRTQLMQQLNKSLSQARRHDVYSALLFFDLDNFKIINDSLGHHAGDELLIEIGERLKNIVREEDTVARLGGDEFVIIASELERDPQVSADQAQQVALKVQEILQQPFMLSEHEHHLTFSIGISMFPIENEDINDILKHADTAMYRAKELGKNRISFFLPSMQQAAEERLYLQNQLRQASIKNQLSWYINLSSTLTTN
ncbi:diguanylate cyclase domain-containing protein [Candidatus Reidiella endopervernicosa]|uniref:Diguanylate cyclase n=1 Tax=Candidatus Reidiella endopervernicosa TaxID=2738883 RepID=A0A6N0HXY0_9GAMM|nr:diguanylate cyclase [Candidatus Reidiella endopervernicosa]QKQ27208.1 diguanylate cyclase [Candidatus Reidiella endopervernicosa]